MLFTSQCWCLLLLLYYNITNWHGIYLSVTEISMSKDQKQISLKVKIFPDDLENVLRLFEEGHYQTEELCNKEKSILAYFSKNLGIKMNQKFVGLKWSGCKEIGDSMELSFYISQQEPIKTMDLKATFFTELFASQQNIIQIKTLNASSVFLKFKGGDSWQSISFPVK